MQGNLVLSMPRREIKAFSLQFLTIQSTFSTYIQSTFCRVGAHE